ncbi:DUF4158 domain-containing protein [Cytobacillus praedii]|uniref:DUF4158 domain-containing protein n=1 Tax=Cytobacillus praedii TaxID=1742358 RepID=UPI002E1BBEB1|nr:DUF4158 domain-containing protein [Cytobacillus praedii]
MNSLGFAVLLKYFQYKGRFPKEKSKISFQVIDYNAKQVDVPAKLLQEYDWDGRSIKYHRAQIRDYMGFRECTLKDLEQLLNFTFLNNVVFFIEKIID